LARDCPETKIYYYYMRSIKALSFASLTLISLYLLSVSCKKATSSTSIPDPAIGTFNAVVNGTTQVYAVTADTLSGTFWINGSGNLAKTGDSLIFELGISDTVPVPLMRGTYTDTNYIKNAWTTFSVMSNGGNDWGSYQPGDAEQPSGFYIKVNSNTGGILDATINGTLYLSQGDGPDSLVFNNSRFRVSYN
jgi:hypothetical protein